MATSLPPKTRRNVHGSGAIVQEDYVDVFGDYCTVIGNYCTVTGSYNKIFGNYCTAIGSYNTITGKRPSAAGGEDNTIREEPEAATPVSDKDCRPSAAGGDDNAVREEPEAATPVSDKDCRPSAAGGDDNAVATVGGEDGDIIDHLQRKAIASRPSKARVTRSGCNLPATQSIKRQASEPGSTTLQTRWRRQRTE